MKYLKIRSSSLAISEFQIKTALRFHLTLIKMTKITKQLTTSVGEDVGKDLSFLLRGKANWFTCSEISVEDPNKQKVDPPLLGICPKDMTSHSTDTCSAMVIATLLTIARKWKQPQFL